LEEEDVPNAELGLEGEGRAEEGDVPFGRKGGGRDHLFLLQVIKIGIESLKGERQFETRSKIQERIVSSQIEKNLMRHGTQRRKARG
jgi:hypothetical protein